MMKVIAAELPSHSALLKRVGVLDFLDCYRVESVLEPRQAADIITDFPLWARSLIYVRNAITSPFGLSKNGPIAEDKVGFFPVESDSDSELIAGFNDKHLDFRVSVMSHQGHVYLATWVHPNNMAGTLYLNAILPFHIVIARNALMRVGSQCSRVRHEHLGKEKRS